ncbi:hypothetical protein NDU88_001091 [Pleurodeles waltl]|uniref:Uncharacterized protein n=1 Tax=Pleurodeles waltl TaxID=8319 RepID=A0AAV7Q397_PLEWA|nr:hypothetical protein NDU88_001091 [Pleurodeles waltl]
MSPRGMASPPRSVAPLPSPCQPTPMLSPGQPAPLPTCQPTPKKAPLESVSAVILRSIHPLLCPVGIRKR